MPRPRCRRRIGFDPKVLYFKPRGQGLSSLEEIVLERDELEALRLKDFLAYEQEKCAKEMQISQPTLHRILLGARKKVSDAIVNGKAIKIKK
jgi:predicted DNA-binding protein (UPF0251 family)